MATFVAGSTGATGRLLVAELLARGKEVITVVRSIERLPPEVRDHGGLSITEATLLDLRDEQLAEQLEGCSSIACCLGHTLSFRGVFGHPRRLVADATRRLCGAIRVANPTQLSKYVLMNSAGVRDRVLGERVSFVERCVVSSLRACVPPHADNEEAAYYLQTEIGPDNNRIEWAVVRPDGLIDRDIVTGYDLYASPTRSAIFDSGQTSRINVGHFMADLITSPEVWQQWRGQMPVIYNRAENGPSGG